MLLSKVYRQYTKSPRRIQADGGGGGCMRVRRRLRALSGSRACAAVRGFAANSGGWRSVRLVLSLQDVGLTKRLAGNFFVESDPPGGIVYLNQVEQEGVTPLSRNDLQPPLTDPPRFRRPGVLNPPTIMRWRNFLNRRYKQYRVQMFRQGEDYDGHHRAGQYS